jgi:hypothetical protein
MTILREWWFQELRRRLNKLIDNAQSSKDGATIARAGALMDRVNELERVAAEIDREVETVEATYVNFSLDVRPPSFLLLPAGGEVAADHFRETVQSRVDPDSLDEWFPDRADLIRARMRGELAAWGLRDNPRVAIAGRPPVSWDRIHLGTMALFSDGNHFVCAARVIGKGRSEAATLELWGSREFPWLLLLTDLRWIEISVEEVASGAGFDSNYPINRQALVPAPERQEGIWRVIQPHLREA